MDRELHDEIEKTLRERAQYFSLRWFERLFRARLSLADTFWVGLFGVLIVAVPALFAAAFAVKVVAPVLALKVFSVLTVALGFYWAAVTRAVVICARSAPQAGGWRWAAVVTGVLCTLGAVGGGLAGLF